MADNYHNMTGVLVLKQITPVIKALFGALELGCEVDDSGETFIAVTAESNSPSWDTVSENLQELVVHLGLQDPDDADAELYLYLLASHFGADNNEELANLIEHTDFDEYAGIDELFTIARAFDDGHGLKAYKTESSWHCSKPRLFEFGGAGAFRGMHVSVGSWSRQAIEMGESLEAALENGDNDTAANLLGKSIGSILAGVQSQDTRDVLRTKLSHLLSNPPSASAVATATQG